MNESAELKGFQVRKTKLESEIKLLEEERKRVDKEIIYKTGELSTIRKKIAAFAVKEPVVTEHALLRYIERVLHIDIEEIKSEILTDKNKAAIQFAPNCRIKAGGLNLIVKDRAVVSVVV